MGRIKGFIIILIFAASCSKMQPGDCFKNTGTITTESRAATPFTCLEMNNNVDVYITYNPTYSIDVRAGKNILPGIKTSISGKTLTISNENTCNWVRSYNSPIEVYLGLPDIDSILYQASGNLTSTNQFQGDSIQLDVLEGAGSINLWVDLHTSKINLQYGTADVIMRGYAHISYLYSGGYGPADLSRMDTEFTFMTNNSLNNCRVKCNLSLETEIHNVGDVYYSGDPSYVSSWETSSGRLYKE